MANILKMMKQAASMKKEMKNIQKELSRKTVKVSKGGDMVTVVARGDMSIDKITINPEAINTKDLSRLEKLLVSAVNDALDSAKKQAGQEMTKLTSGMGLPDLF